MPALLLQVDANAIKATTAMKVSAHHVLRLVPLAKMARIVQYAKIATLTLFRKEAALVIRDFMITKAHALLV